MSNREPDYFALLGEYATWAAKSFTTERSQHDDPDWRKQFASEGADLFRRLSAAALGVPTDTASARDTSPTESADASSIDELAWWELGPLGEETLDLLREGVATVGTLKRMTDQALREEYGLSTLQCGIVDAVLLDAGVIGDDVRSRVVMTSSTLLDKLPWGQQRRPGLDLCARLLERGVRTVGRLEQQLETLRLSDAERGRVVAVLLAAGRRSAGRPRQR